ncbi:hypothetical protein F5Y15DRAFT_200359 [Xylariaceae sp. FL0016]|nr:hypothetical protein F5Y15DRAFT_200359 [Xylariaceae sp. FL0016]
MSSSGQDESLHTAAQTTSQRVKKKRVRNFTENDRAAHRVFEKSRREAFKEALTNLASLLPSLAETEPQRLSKHVVVDESIAFIRSQQSRIDAAAEQLQATERERDELLAEVNQWRTQSGIELRRASAADNFEPHRFEASHHPQPMVSPAIPSHRPAAPESKIPPAVPVAEASLDANPVQVPPPPPPDTYAEATGMGMPWGGFPSAVQNFEAVPSHLPVESVPSVPDPSALASFDSGRPQQASGFSSEYIPPFTQNQPYDTDIYQNNSYLQTSAPIQSFVLP